MDGLSKGRKVDFTLDAAAAEQLVTADSVGGQLLLLFLGHANLECVLISRDDGVS